MLDGDRAPHQIMKGPQPLPQFSAHVHCGQTALWIKMSLGMKVGVGQGHIVLDGDPVPLSPPKKKVGTVPPHFFGPCLLWPNSRLS